MLKRISASLTMAHILLDREALKSAFLFYRWSTISLGLAGCAWAPPGGFQYQGTTLALAILAFCPPLKVGELRNPPAA
jgi:hypothetical protein